MLPSTHYSPSDRICPDCQAVNPAEAKSCWLCKRDFPPPGTIVELAQPATEKLVVSRPLPRAVATTNTFSLSTMFLWVTLLSVMMGLFAIAPGLGIAAAIFVAPAAARTVWTVQRRKKQTGESLNTEEKVEVFLGTMSVAIAIVAAAVAAFVVTCWPVGMALTALGESGFGLAIFLAIPIGIIAAIVAGYAVWRSFNRGE